MTNLNSFEVVIVYLRKNLYVMIKQITNRNNEFQQDNKTCALCGEKVANKTNTHCLTDAIIKRCLNIDGSTSRNKGSYYKISPQTASVQYNYQRGVLPEINEEILGRATTEEEDQQARRVPFSVNYVFCSDCEKLFTQYETSFINSILNKFRRNAPHNTSEISIKEVETIRMFFYLQLWRSSVCLNFNLSNSLQQKLHNYILHPKEHYDEMNNIPLSITYLETRKDEDYTNNIIVFGKTCNPYVIFMNDFVIQIYDPLEHMHFDELYGINELSNFKRYINFKEKEFIVKVIKDEKRKQILENFFGQQIDIFLQQLLPIIISLFQNLCNRRPTPKEIKEILYNICQNQYLGSKFSPSGVEKEVNQYVYQNIIKKTFC